MIVGLILLYGSGLVIFAIVAAWTSRCAVCHRRGAIWPSELRTDPTTRCWTHFQIPKKIK